MTSAAPRPQDDFPFVEQLEARDCAYACLRMIARHHGGDHDFTGPEFAGRLSRDGMSVLTLTEVAEEIGFDVCVLRGTAEEFVSQAPLPCIVLWQQNHFMVVHAVTEEMIHIANPARGFEALSYEEFRQGWTIPDAGADSGEDGAAEGILVGLTPAPSP